jgi:acyl-homoserine lactone acylase PvdQ
VYTHNGVNHSLSGISTAGVPFIVGKTDYFAMGITTIYMDNQDLYRERIEGNKYFVNNKWVDLQIR